MVSWFLTIPAVALGATTGLLVAATDPAQTVEAAKEMHPLEVEAYQQICQAEARHQGAPEAVIQGSCRCLQQRLEALDQPPDGQDDLKAFTKENRLDCVFEAILEL